jgi:hypothetical protein
MNSDKMISMISQIYEDLACIIQEKYYLVISR